MRAPDTVSCAPAKRRTPTRRTRRRATRPAAAGRNCCRRSDMAHPVPVYEISVPEYTAEREPDYTRVGLKLDRVIETYFPDRKMAIRGIGLVDHPDWSLDELARMILERGTDRYDPEREGVNYPAGSTNLDIHACPFVVVAGKL